MSTRYLSPDRAASGKTRAKARSSVARVGGPFARPDVERWRTGAADRSAIPRSVGDALRSPSQPLDAGGRAFFEPRFGHDFSQVRVHADEAAARSARAVGATAFALGNHIVLGRDAPDPATPEGSRLLAHELAHVVQQSSETRPRLGPSAMVIGSPDDPAEREAERAADDITSHRRPTTVASLGWDGPRDGTLKLRRQAGEEQPKKTPKPLIPLPHPLDGLDIKPIVPLPGGIQPPSTEDVNKAYHSLPGQQGGEPADTHCLEGWTYRKTGDVAGMCCQGVSIDKDKCCPPKRLHMTITGATCDREPAPDKGTSPKPGPDKPSGPAPVPPGKAEFPLKLPPLTPPLTVDLPIHFKQDQPRAVLTAEKALRGSLTEAGGSDLDLVIAWLQQKPEFSVQLTGMASIEGTAARNEELGENRARSIARVLIQNGISASRIADPPGQAPGCAPISGGVENCGASRASKSIDANDRQVRARMFIAPGRTGQKP
jgi:hypothetical protein